MTQFRLTHVLTAALLAISSWSQAANVTQSFKLLPNAGEGAAADRMGQSTAVSGNTAVVGAFLADEGSASDAGSVYVYTRSGANWSEQQQLIAPTPTQSDLFGFAVAISENTLAVGAPLDDESAGADAGAVYVYTRSGVSWSLQQRLVASDVTGNDQFGRSVAIDGDTLVVGAQLDDSTGNNNSGAAYVFQRTAGVWGTPQRLLASDASPGDYFGASAAISGDRLVIGAERADSPNVDAGAAYAFARDANGNWAQQSKLLPAAGNADDNFGISVSISGNTIIVGQPYLGAGSGSNKGSASVFTESAGSWSFQATLAASDGAADDYFGRSVAISGDLIVVSAFYDDLASAVDGGSAYLFRRTGSTWTQTDKYLGSDTLLNDLLGSSVALSGGNAIVGAPFDANSFGTDAGSAYVYSRDDATLTALTVSSTSLGFGQNITLNATVSHAGIVAAPAGSITFFSGASALGTVALDGNLQAQLTVAPNAGNLAITARYLGDAGHLASSSPIRTVLVTPGSTSVALSPGSSINAQFGDPLSFVATISVAPPASGPVSGNMLFKDDATTIALVPIVAGSAQLDTNTLSVGVHNISAQFPGDGNFLPFTTPVTQVTIVKATVNLVLTVSPEPSLEGASATLTATLVGGIPTGNIGFFDCTSGMVPLDSAIISSGVASVATASLALGAYDYCASYSGDSNNFGAFGNSTTHNVLAAANLSITKTNNVSNVQSGSTTLYNIIVFNNGPNAVTGATVVDAIDDDLVTGLFQPNAPWTCTGSNGGVCSAPSGNGQISLPVDLPAGASVQVDVSPSIRADAEPFISNSASISLPANRGDPNLLDNVSVDSDFSGVFADSLEDLPPPQ